MTYHITERSPIGTRRWTITTCTSCSGKGRTWYAGCGDTDMPCRRCDGMGETATYRWLDKNGVPFGPGRTDP